MERKKGERQRDLESAERLGTEANLEGGAAGGNVARDVGAKDDMKRGFVRPAGATRVEKEEKSKAARSRATR